MKTTIQKVIRYSGSLLVAGALAAPGLLQAQPTAHYVPGVEGIKGASLPPPGVYFRDYNVFYYGSQLNDNQGNNVTPAGFRAMTYANVPRVLWITDTTFLGGYVGVDALLPLVWQSVKVPAGGIDQDTFGIGDLFGEATLSWHFQQADVSLAAGVWAPTGDSPSGRYGVSTRAGLGYWTPMLTAGATWYIDTAKTWAVSALSRYEFNTEQRNTDITPGQAYTLEWGVSKTLAKVVDVGAVGYYQQKVTTDSGTGALSFRDRVAAVGPEVSVAFPEQMFFLSFRYVYEFMAEGASFGPPRAQGHTFTLTLTKRF